MTFSKRNGIFLYDFIFMHFLLLIPQIWLFLRTGIIVRWEYCYWNIFNLLLVMDVFANPLQCNTIWIWFWFDFKYILSWDGIYLQKFNRWLLPWDIRAEILPTWQKGTVWCTDVAGTQLMVNWRESHIAATNQVSREAFNSLQLRVTGSSRIHLIHPVWQIKYKIGCV